LATAISVVLADDDLRHAAAIADIDESDAAEIADAVHPAEEHCLRPDIRGAKGAARMGPAEIAERFRHQKKRF
jgi:hypothetical protein